MKFKKKKVTKKRASTYHGFGRGASHHKGGGNRGGRGRAGSGKRADAKKPSFWKQPVGKHGFTSKTRFIINPINLELIQKNLHSWVEQGKAVKNAGSYSVELAKLGYNKLLGNGEIKEKITIITDFASKNAIVKVKAAGGEVTVLKKIVKKQKKSANKKKEIKEATGAKEAKETKAAPAEAKEKAAKKESEDDS